MNAGFRFGIIGAGMIAEVVADAIKGAGVSLVAVASRRLEWKTPMKQKTRFTSGFTCEQPRRDLHWPATLPQ